MKTTDEQEAANRRNAVNSTGPVTPAGKLVAAQNAVKHGLRGQFHLITGEDPGEYEEFCRLLYDQLGPSGALEEALVERVISGFWRLRRVERIEVEMIDRMCEDDLRERRRDAVVESLAPTALDFAARAAHPAPAQTPSGISLGGAIRRQLQSSDVIGKFHRYEAHIERGLFRALHELERLQGIRRGQAVPAPVAIDITTDLKQDS